MKNKINKQITNQQSKRRLSPWRVLLGLLLLSGCTYSTTLAVQEWQDNRITGVIDPWFAPYIDVTATPKYAFEQLDTAQVKNATLAFIVSHPEDACQPSWGGYYTLEEAVSALDLDRRIARYRQQGGNVVISFGGLLNDELALHCQSRSQLLAAYQAVIDQYDADTIDLDLEGEGLTNQEALVRRAEVIAQLQQQQRYQGKNLAVWLTLPVAPFGLTQDGTNAVAQMLESGVDIAGVNLMTMNYGQSRDPNHTMQQASERALIEAHRQLGILYHQAGINLNSASLWTKIGATPMIGQNDLVEDVFTLEDAAGFNKFAQEKRVARMSIWSVNRDIQCGENYVNWSMVSDSCSGIEQDKLEFSVTLSEGFDGELSQNAAVITQEDPQTEIKPDDPTTSPYPIWDEKATYLQGTKIVWHGQVYRAKWWTQGELPDNPVLQSWETPWQLLGPVLPGEKPVLQPTLPAGTYPQWSGLETYEAGQRVLFNNIPYQAKWWTQGDSPAAASSDPDGSPWVVLTQQQVEDIITELEASPSAN